MARNMVSVIIPVYQAEKYIRGCIESVQNQTYQDLEIIVVNDGSTDATYDIIKEIATTDKRIIIVNQDNKGVSEARNVGIESANGEFITFVDSDDKIEPELCENLVNVMIEKNTDVVISGISIIKKNQIRIITENKLQKYNKVEMLQKYEVHANSYIYQNVLAKLYRTEILKQCKFNKDIRLGEDLLFNYQVFAYVSNICIIPYSGYKYLLNQQSATHRFDSDDFETQKAVRKYESKFYLDALGGQEISQIIEKRYVANSINIIVSLVTTESYKNCMKYLKIYLQDNFFQEKLTLYGPSDFRLKVAAFFCKKKAYMMLYILGKMNKWKNKITK